jgi:hypothetical protein
MYPQAEVPRVGSGLEPYNDRVRTSYSRLSRYQETEGGYPYDTYRTDDRVYFPVTTSPPDLSRFRLKDVVLGICRDGRARAYAFVDMPDGAVINDRVGAVDLVVLFDADTRTAIPYERTVDGQLLKFTAVPPGGDLPVAFMDVETGTRWNLLGEAVSGPLRGRRLQGVPSHNSMWFAWSAFWPETDVWDGGGIIADVATAVDAMGHDSAPGLRLAAPAPNPFNSATRIRFELPRAATIELDIRNIAGQRVRRLRDGPWAAGRHEVIWDGRDDAGQVRRQRLTLAR